MNKHNFDGMNHLNVHGNQNRNHNFKKVINQQEKDTRLGTMYNSTDEAEHMMKAWSKFRKC